jgi:hypothetical protein
MKLLYKLIINIKLYYYTFLDYLDDGPMIYTPGRQIERSQQNIKLIRGVKKLINRLRSMPPEYRTQPENLLGVEPYKKTKQELRGEYIVRHKVINNPAVTTTDDLVAKVMKNAPRYAKENEVKETRKALTACLKQARLNPSNLIHSTEAKRLKAKLSSLKVEIERMKNG